jgi:protein gp37
VGKTSIEWTDHSWPIVNGCRRVSAGCQNCYAERLSATRLSQTPKYKGLAVYGKNGPRWTGESRLWVPHLDMPLHLKKPSRIFVADMGDLFYEKVADEDIAAVFGVMAACPQHTFQVLTKRPERMRRWFDSVSNGSHARAWCVGAAARRLEGFTHSGDLYEWPLPNVWLGTSVEDQATADERIPHLLETPAAVRFLSAEPLLGPVQLHPGDLGCVDHLASTFGNPLINWIIVGGESGPGARHMDLAWARGMVEQCEAAGVACFVKQLGARPFERDDPMDMRLADRKGGQPDEWPDDLRVREFPLARASQLVRKQKVQRGGDRKTGAVTGP